MEDIKKMYFNCMHGRLLGKGWAFNRLKRIVRVKICRLDYLGVDTFITMK